MFESFEREKIEAGYLLRVTELGTGEAHNMTVIPISATQINTILQVLIGATANADGDLGCCCPEKHWCRLAEFDEDGVAVNIRIDAIYGRTATKFLLDNSAKNRELLWERKTEQDAEPVEAEGEIDAEPVEAEGEIDARPVKMTLAEIEAALGHAVEITSKK